MQLSSPITVCPKRTTIPFQIGEGEGASRVRIKCIAADSLGVFEVGKRYSFASRRNTPIFSRRHRCEFTLWLIRRTFIAEETAAKMRLSENKIGELHFVPSSPKSDLGPAYRASLEVMIYPNDCDFNFLLEAFTRNTQPSWVRIHVQSKNDNELRFGWEPDGARKEWNFDDSKSRVADVTGFETNMEF